MAWIARNLGRRGRGHFPSLLTGLGNGSSYVPSLEAPCRSPHAGRLHPSTDMPMNIASQPRQRGADLSSSSPHADAARSRLRGAFLTVRGETERRAAPLSAEDQVVQSMPDASPTKWHRAHTTWFFEQFILVPNASAYEVFDERFAFLFNSYYVSAGPRHARPKRGLVTRPSMAEVADYRAHVDSAMLRLIDDADAETFARL